MFFMGDLDNLFMTSEDYRQLAEFLETYEHKDDYRASVCFEALNFVLHHYLKVTVHIAIVLAVAVACFVCFCPTPMNAEQAAGETI